RDTTQFRGICNSDVVTGIAALQQLPDVEEVTAGGTHALFRTASGEVWSLGANLAGQAGLGTTSVMECAQGIAVSRVRGATDIAAGGEHSLALMKGVVTLSPTLLNFGNQAVGTSSAPAREVSITNSGLVPITFSDI